MANLSNRAPMRVQSFNGGQYSAAEAAFIPQHSAKELKNIVIDNLGRASQRRGLELLSTTPDELTFHVTYDDDTSDDVIAELANVDTDVTFVDGKFGRAGSFNGTTSKTVYDADTAVDVNTLGSMTVTAWVYPNNDGEGNAGRIIDKFSGTDVGYRLWLSGSDTTPVINFEVGYVTTNALAVSVGTVAVDTWTKIDAVLQADHSIDIYINGVVTTYSTDTDGVGGVNDDSAVDLNIGNNAASTATFNGYIDDVRINSTPLTAANLQQSKVYGLTRFRVPNVIDKMYRIVGTSLQAIDSDLKGFTDIDTGFTTKSTTRFFQARASDGTYRLVMCNNEDNVHSMTTAEVMTDEGSGADDPPTDSPWGEWHDNRAFFIDSNGDIRFSDVLDFQTCTSTNIFRAKSPAVCVKSFKEKQMMIYSQNKIEILDTSGATPLEDWGKTILSEGIEFNSPFTVVNVGDDQVFLAKDGVRLLSRTKFDKIQSGVMSGPIKDIIDRINVDQIHKACAHLIDNKYVLSVPIDTATENNFVLVWDLTAAKIMGKLESGWTVIPADDWNISMFTEFEFSDNKITLVGGDARALSQTYKCFSSDTDIGKTVTSEIVSIEHTVDRVTDTIWDPVHVVAASGVSTTYSIEMNLDNVGGVEVTTMDLTGGAPILPIALPFDLGGTARVEKLFRTKQLGRATLCQLNIIHNTYNRRPTFIEYTLFARKLKPRFT